MTEHYSIRCLFFIIENVFLGFYTILKHILSFIYLFIFLNLSLVINDSSGITESFRGRKVLGVLFHINNFLQSLESIYLFRYNVWTFSSKSIPLPDEFWIHKKNQGLRYLNFIVSFNVEFQNQAFLDSCTKLHCETTECNSEPNFFTCEFYIQQKWLWSV